MTHNSTLIPPNDITQRLNPLTAAHSGCNYPKPSSIPHPVNPFIACHPFSNHPFFPQLPSRKNYIHHIQTITE